MPKYGLGTRHMISSSASAKALLDSDWKRLQEVAGGGFRKRRMRDAFSPRFAHIVLIRHAHAFYGRGMIGFARLLSLLNFLLFGMEVPAKLSIGPGLIIPHTQGVILGAASIGANVTIYQQVTLGAKMADWGYDLDTRPVVEDGVTITAGAKVLGAVTLGRNCIVGANAVVLNDVMPDCVVGGIPARVLSAA